MNNNDHDIYAFLRLPPFFASVPDAASAPDAVPAALASASKISGVYPGVPAVVPAASRAFNNLLESNAPTTGIPVAIIVWNGAATKCPAASNHSLNGRLTVSVSALLDPLRVTSTVRW